MRSLALSIGLLLGLLSPLSAQASDSKGPVMFGGDVFTEAGGPVEIEARIWPNQQELRKLPVGSVVPTIPIPLEINRGHYAVRLDPTKVPAGYQDENGVEVVVEVFADGKVDSYGEKLRPSAAGWQRNALVEAQTARAEQLRLTSGSSTKNIPGTLTALRAGPKDKESSALVLRRANLREVSATNSSSQMAAGCPRKWFKTDVKWTRKVKISDVMPSKSYMKGMVRYKVGTKHSIQVGVKVGNNVSGGSNLSVSSDEKVNPVAWKGDKTARTKWRFRRYTHGCVPTWHQARPETHQGGYTTVNRSRPNYKKCSKYRKMNEWSQARGKAWTYGAGWQLWGVNFDAQTGYNSKTELVYRFPKKSRWLCGSNAYPPQARLVAGYSSNQN